MPALRRTLADPEASAQTGDLAERVAAIIFTSGTTGQPKGVMLTHAGLLQFGKVSAQSRQLLPTDRSYAYLPMTHIFGLGTVLMASLHAGAGLLMRSQFDPADVFDALAHQGLTQLQGPPAMFTRLLAWLDSQGMDHPAAPDLRYVYTGAAPLDLSVKKAIEARFGQPLHHGYGLSEYAGALTLCRRGEWRDDTSAGYLVEGAELRIVDAQRQPHARRPMAVCELATRQTGAAEPALDGLLRCCGVGPVLARKQAAGQRAPHHAADGLVLHHRHHFLFDVAAGQ